MKLKVGAAEVNVSNPDKVFFPERGLKKIDLVEYYVDVAPCVLPHVRRRLFHMKRFPNGVDHDFFHQKRVPANHPTVSTSNTSSFRAATRRSSPSSTTRRRSRGSSTWAASSCTRGTRACPTSSGPTIS